MALPAPHMCGHINWEPMSPACYQDGERLRGSLSSMMAGPSDVCVHAAWGQRKDILYIRDHIFGNILTL